MNLKVEIKSLGDNSELVVSHKGETIACHRDGGEPEDQSFYRDWYWVLPLLYVVYNLGLNDGTNEFIKT